MDGRARAITHETATLKETTMPHRIAVIAGDGIGKETVPEGLRALDAAMRRFGIDLQFEHFDFAHCEYFAKHGQMMPDDWKEQLGGFEAIFFGAVGWPETVPDHVSLWGSLIKFRREFDQYVNMRPARLMPGVRSPLVDRQGQPLAPGAIDMLIVRENTEGEYSAVGGRMYEGTEREIVMQQTVMSRYGVDRVLKFAYEEAMKRPRRKLTSATKSNGIAITMPYWDERVDAMARQYPEVATDRFHIDILSAHFVQRPQQFDVVVASNLFGDILSDLGPACTGTIGIAPSANLNPTRKWPSLFEPVHGSAPDIAGRGVANPIGQIWSAALMLDFLGYRPAHDAILQAIESVLADDHAPRTPDLGGRAGTGDVGSAIAGAIMQARS
jgi:tartrate dehydrogenase/decarboxylase/D-malate dehydrogenase